MPVYSGANSTAAWQTARCSGRESCPKPAVPQFPRLQPRLGWERLSPHFLAIYSWKAQAVIIGAIYSTVNKLLI